jgi:hypothetical protein
MGSPDETLPLAVKTHQSSRHEDNLAFFAGVSL